uniref:TGF-beta family profile domain-containing protein n=1 Tax=Neovison vison TaxID=452646 RepID=A0A8C7B856_NEOVI
PNPHWLSWASAVAMLGAVGPALSGEHILSILLRQLQLQEAPILDTGDVEELVTPAHVMAQYVALLQRSHGVRSRGSAREVAGRWLASEASTHLLVFSMEWWMPLNSNLVWAGRAASLPGYSTRACVTFEWLRVREDSSNSTLLVDSRLVSLLESGWKAFDVTEVEMYIDLQGMKWAENSVLEPLGFLAYECVGACQQPPRPLPLEWPFLGPRQCIASETTSLPMIVSVKEGGRARLQVVSRPNRLARVQKCGCSWEGCQGSGALGGGRSHRGTWLCQGYCMSWGELGVTADGQMLCAIY